MHPMKTLILLKNAVITYFLCYIAVWWEINVLVVTSMTHMLVYAGRFYFSILCLFTVANMDMSYGMMSLLFGEGIFYPN